MASERLEGGRDANVHDALASSTVTDQLAHHESLAGTELELT